MRRQLEHCLQPFQHNKRKFLHKYVTMDETWIHHFPPESNRQSAKWTATGQSDQRCKHQQARFWHPYFGMSKVFCSSITLRKKEPLIVNSIIGAFEGRNRQKKKTATNEEEKNALSPRQGTVSQVDCNDGKTA